MSDTAKLLQEIYKDLGHRETFTTVEDFTDNKFQKWLDIVDEKLNHQPDDFLLLALKSELLDFDEPEKAATIARFITENTAHETLTEETRQARGIAFYVLACQNDNRHLYTDKLDTLKFYRMALDLFPAHYYAAAMFADKVVEGQIPYEEAISRLELAISGNSEPEIIAGFYNQAAYISQREDTKATIKYYEASRTIRNLNQSQTAYLALAYARTGNYREALKNFGESWKTELEQILKIRETSPFYSPGKRGYDHPLIWNLVDEAVDEYEKQPVDRNLIYMAMCFKYLPSIAAAFVIDDVREKLTNRSDVHDLSEALGYYETMALPEELRITEPEFFRLAENSTVIINSKLKEKQPHKPKPFQVMPARVKTFDIYHFGKDEE